MWNTLLSGCKLCWKIIKFVLKYIRRWRFYLNDEERGRERWTLLFYLYNPQTIIKYGLLYIEATEYALKFTLRSTVVGHKWWDDNFPYAKEVNYDMNTYSQYTSYNWVCVGAGGNRLTGDLTSGFLDKWKETGQSQLGFWGRWTPLTTVWLFNLLWLTMPRSPSERSPFKLQHVFLLMHWHGIYLGLPKRKGNFCQVFACHSAISLWLRGPRDPLMYVFYTSQEVGLISSTQCIHSDVSTQTTAEGHPRWGWYPVHQCQSISVTLDSI